MGMTGTSATRVSSIGAGSSTAPAFKSSKVPAPSVGSTEGTHDVVGAAMTEAPSSKYEAAFCDPAGAPAPEDSDADAPPPLPAAVA
jgi:hypothetical protein